MRNLLLLLSIGLLSSFSYAQSMGIKGKVTFNENGLPYVSIIVKNPSDSSIIKTGLTDSAGKFAVHSLASGRYYIELQMMGFAPYRSSVIEVNKGLTDLGDLVMTTDDQIINTVQVKVLRPIVEVHPDKTVFNVENTINNTGSDALELLRKAPGVIIDNNNNITLEGKGGVMVFIDGKPTVLSGEDLSNYLQSLQATDVDAIELITQPSSKYDAAGNAGIINIRLKRNKNFGTNGSVNAGYSKGVNHRAMGGLSLNHRNRHFNLFSNFSTRQGQNWHFINFNRLQEGVNYISKTKLQRAAGSYNSKIGMDWYVGQHSIIGGVFNGNFMDGDATGNSVTEISSLANPGTFQNLDASNTTSGSNYQITGNLNYRYRNKGTSFNIDFDRGLFDRQSNTFQPNIYTDGETGVVLLENNYRMITPTRIVISTAKMDYTQSLWGGNFGAGLKYSLVNTDNSFDFYDIDSSEVLNLERSNKFYYDENVNAAYINYGLSLNKRTQLQMGLRGEQTVSKGELISTQSNEDDLVNRNYFNLFPTVSLSYNASRNHMWTLSTGRRIQRPNYQSLNPFVQQVSELSYRKGNPFLQPQYNWNTRISHTYAYRFSTSLSYSHNADFSAQVTDTFGATTSFLQPRNVATQQIINIGLSYPIQITRWWSLFFNSNNNMAFYTGTDEKYESLEIFTAGFFAQNTFILPKGYKLELSGWGRTPSVWGGTYLTKSMGSLSIGIEKKFLNEQLSLRAKLSDIFFSEPWRADLHYGPLEISGTGGHESRQFNFTVSYNFGNKNVKASKHQTGSEEEQNRTQGE